MPTCHQTLEEGRRTKRRETFSVDFLLLWPFLSVCPSPAVPTSVLVFTSPGLFVHLYFLPPFLLPLSVPSVEGDWGTITLALKLLAPALTSHSPWAPAIRKALRAAHHYCNAQRQGKEGWRVGWMTRTVRLGSDRGKQRWEDGSVWWWMLKL